MEELSEQPNNEENYEEHDSVQQEMEQGEIVLSGAESPASGGKAKKAKSKDGAKKAKKVDTKDKIKRAPSAFILFCTAKRPEVKASHPNAGFGETGKILGEQWAQLDAESRAIYTKISADKKAVVDVARAEAKAKAPKKATKPPSPYMLFCTQARLKVKETHPTATFGETGKILGAMWGSLKEDEKAVYTAAAAEQKATWVQETASTADGNTNNNERVEKESKTKEPKAAAAKKALKRPPTPYMIFCSQARIQVKTTHPDATFGETGKILGAMWGSLDDRSKELYFRAAAEQKAVWPTQERGQDTKQAAHEDPQEGLEEYRYE